MPVDSNWKNSYRQISFLNCSLNKSLVFLQKPSINAYNRQRKHITYLEFYSCDGTQ